MWPTSHVYVHDGSASHKDKAPCVRDAHSLCPSLPVHDRHATTSLCAVCRCIPAHHSGIVRPVPSPHSPAQDTHARTHTRTRHSAHDVTPAVARAGAPPTTKMHPPAVARLGQSLGDGGRSTRAARTPREAHRLRGGVSGREPPPKVNFCFSAGFRMRKEHMSDSSMAITAPALSNSPQ